MSAWNAVCMTVVGFGTLYEFFDGTFMVTCKKEANFASVEPPMEHTSIV